jgi:clan AA aspartic protease (TIGR02281 family)
MQFHNPKAMSFSIEAGARIMVACRSGLAFEERMKRLTVALYCTLLVVSVAARAHDSPPLAAQPVRAEAVPLKRENGTFVVPVVINNQITLNFTLDSGATDVSIPVDVFSTLVRTGTIQQSDYLDTQVYSLADGSTTQTPRFRIRFLRVGSVELRDVSASVGPKSSSPLLGQSFLARLASWAIDNNRQLLVINGSANALADGANSGASTALSNSAGSDRESRRSLVLFRGSYICAQGLTALMLRILTPSTAGETRAQFSFGPSQLNPSVPDGSFSMAGHVDWSRGTMTLRPIEWIQRPEPYVMVGLEGASSDGGKTFYGRVVGEGCASFSMIRIQ